MDQNQDFSSLRNLLALKKLEVPMDTEVNRFLIEFHRRQRAQLMVPPTLWARALAWIKERAAGLELVPSLSYGSAFAAIALTAFFGLSQQVQVTHAADGQYKLSLRMPTQESSFAMIPAAFGSALSASQKTTDTLSFNPAHSDSATTRFVLANSHAAHDANVAF
ncbi:MAG TPA: hypothetical protein VGC39_03080 [Candidatus Methylacidiphilales bacterium]